MYPFKKILTLEGPKIVPKVLIMFLNIYPKYTIQPKSNIKPRDGQIFILIKNINRVGVLGIEMVLKVRGTENEMFGYFY